MNNRLDFISKIDQKGIDKMTNLRMEYIRLDQILRDIILNSNPNDMSFHRTLELSRTNLEISLQFAIKTLCIKYEI